MADIKLKNNLGVETTYSNVNCLLVPEATAGNVTFVDSNVTTVNWGNIGGTLSNQTDLQTELNAKESLNNKTTAINQSSTDTQYPSAKAVFDTEQDLREIAEGKCQSYVVSKFTNPVFDTQDASFQLSGTFIDTKGNTHNVTDLKLGDNIYVLETDVPDRWCSDPQQIIPVVPEGYTQLEYIESSGTQYINTNLYISATSKVEIQTKIKSNPSTVEADIISNQDGATNRFVVGWFQNYFFQYCRAGTTGYPNNTSAVQSLLQDYNLNIIYNLNSSRQLTVNNTSTISNMCPASLTSNNTVKVFCGQSASATNYFKGRMYYCNIIEDNITTLALVPAKRNSDNAVGFWDTVSETFFTNAGTGTFTYSELPEGTTLYKLETAKPTVTDVQINNTSAIPQGSTVANITLNGLGITASASDLNILNSSALTTPGTYTLKATVSSSGAVTYTWVAE